MRSEDRRNPPPRLPRCLRLAAERRAICSICGDSDEHCSRVRASYHAAELSVAEPTDERAGASPGQGLLHAQDLALSQRALARDQVAVEQLASRLRCIARILAARNARVGRMLSREDLEDLGQEVVAKIWQQLPAYRGIGPLEAWTHSYCDHAFRNAVRRRGRAGRAFEQLPDESLIPDRSAADDGPEAGLQRCLQRLRDEDQWVLHRKHHDGATLEEIAAGLAMNLNTLKSRYARALQQLRQCLEGGGE
jgi:RNA polymerase sigma factor (sigma-70 family)